MLDSLIWGITGLILTWLWLRFRLSARFGLGLIAIVLILFTWFGISQPLWSAMIGCLWMAAAPWLLFPKWRRKVLIKPIMRALKSRLPRISPTERAAIDAGTTGWETELFQGRPNFTALFGNSAPTLTAKEQAFLNGPVETLCELLDDWEITQELNRLPDAAWQYMRQQGFFGMIIPERYGGLELSALAHSNVVMKLASRSVSGAVTVMVPNSLGPAELLLHYGTEAQKDYYLPRLARGDEIPCFALTNPQAGSDASSIPDYGVVCFGDYGGKQVLGLKLNWEKRYITLGPVATLLGLAFKVYDPDHLLGAQQSLGITCALIPTDTPGIEIGARHYPLNAAFQNGPNRGRDVFIPMDWVIGGQRRIGQGWPMLMETLAAGRGISLPALSTAGSQLAVLSTGAYARIRRQFHKPIGQFEGVAEVLARMGGLTYLMDAGRLMLVTALDRGERPALASAMVKYQLTEMMRQVVNDAMDVHGGRGICLGPANYLGRVYQSLPISITVEGANILTRSLMIFGQGAMRCHPWLLQEIEAVHDADVAGGLQRLETALAGHIGFSLRSLVRVRLFPKGRARLPLNSNSTASIAHYRKALGHLSRVFALLAECTLLKLGGSIKRRESISGRFADALAFLYLGSAALQRYHAEGRQEADLPLLHWSLTYSLSRIEVALSAILQNFPSTAWAWGLSRVTRLHKRRYLPPSDALNQEVAAILMTPSPVRERLVSGIYRAKRTDDPVGRVEYALQLSLQAEPLLAQLKQAGLHRRYDEPHSEFLRRAVSAGILENAQAEILAAAEAAVRFAERVDAFAPDKVRKTRRWAA